MLPLQRDLERNVEGEVRFDTYTRILYSTDASSYQIEPIGVVIPKSVADVIATVEIARTHRVPILPRGGGTSLAGQAVGHAVHLDMSKYMNKILEVNAEEQWVRVQPGVVLDELNAYLRPTGLFFGPNVSPSNRANIGGMIGNNSSGSHSIIYGKTIDNVEELKVILTDGREVHLKALTPEELHAKQLSPGIEGQAYRTVARVVDRNRDEILRRYPKVMRRVSGYNLDEFVKDQPFNLTKLLVGSEGTLAVVTEAKLKLVPRPKMTAVDVVHFRDLIEAMEASQEILNHHPAAIELIDRMIINMTRSSLEYSRKMTFVEGDPAALLFVEFHGESREELEEKLVNLEARLKEKGYGFAYVRALEEEEKGNIWAVRKAGLGLLLGVKGDRKPLAFVEDTAVAPEKLPQFVKRFTEIIESHETTAGYYGHASVGCLHIRPLINMKQASEIKKMRSIAEQVLRLVMEFEGAMSGEHGDGLARSEWNEIFFGSQLYNAFREVKRAFDPYGMMNPGKIVDAPRMDENLRYGADYQAIQVPTHLDFSREGGFDRAIELCNGMGVCRKKIEGTMCPSFMVTMDEEHSTRGRANLLRA
ncbi:MAG: FAD-binding oxidoreductase, partial [Nitrospinota bacterium]